MSSLTTIGCRLARDLATAGRAEVVVVELKSDVELPSPGALRSRVREAVAGAISTNRTEARAPERSQIELRIEKSGGALRVSAELRRASGFWRRLLRKQVPPELRGFVEVPIDAELRTLVPPPPLVATEVLKLRAPERGIVAIACGPLRADGGQELVLVSRSTIRTGRIVKGAFAERARASWAALSPVAPAPLRQAIASATITSQHTVRVALSDRRDGVELDSDLRLARRFEGRLPLAGGGCTVLRPTGLAGIFSACELTDPPARRFAPIVDAVAGFGSVQLARTPDGELRTPRGLVAGLERVGAELAVGDADGDEAPEVAFSASTLDPTQDRLSVATLRGDQVTRRFHLSAPRISAVAICARREAAAMAPIAVATGDELWLIR